MFEFGAVVIVFDGAVVMVFDGAAFMFVLVLLALVVLFAVSPPQAAPIAAKPKSAESAIAFFMFKNFLLSSSKINLRFSALGQFAPKTLSIFGTNEMILR